MTEQDILYAAQRIHEQGVPCREAICMACRAAGRIRPASDTRVGCGYACPKRDLLGQLPTSIEAITGQVQEVKAAISPWLWVFSIAGFGLALLNTKRISRMFRTWKKGQMPARA